mgnify:FL=1
MDFPGSNSLEYLDGFLTHLITRLPLGVALLSD